MVVVDEHKDTSCRAEEGIEVRKFVGDKSIPSLSISPQEIVTH